MSELARGGHVTLSDALRAWMPQQRWFAGKGREIEQVEVAELAVLAEEPRRLVLCSAAVHYADAGLEHYQVPLSFAGEAVEALVHGLVAAVDDTWVYDGVQDREVTQAWLRHAAADSAVGSVRFHRVAPEVTIDTTLVSRSLGVEQSNSSMVFGEDLIFKIYRRLVAGENPDVEVHRALALAGSKHIAAPYAWVDGRWPGPDGESLSGSFGLCQAFLRTASEGWALALASVRDLYAEGDLHADEVGGDFAGEAERLGAATAEVHADLAVTLGTATIGSPELRALADGMRERLDEACRVVEELADCAPAVRQAYDAVPGVSGPVRVQRIHGDYHLGQVLRTESGWVLLDFEGEPARPLRERRALASPLKDVAGMLRSFDYAARHLLADHAREPHLEYRAAEWAERNKGAFCEGYAQASGHDPREQMVLLRAYELDKAVYEVVYEARNRPSWLSIPLRSLQRIVATTRDLSA
jgi:maltokinase